MLTLTPAKEIKGHIRIPPSQDLFFLATVIAVGGRCAARILPPVSSPRTDAWIEALKSQVSVQREPSFCRIEPSAEPGSGPLRLSYGDIPYRDFTVFLLLGRFGALCFDALPARRLEEWQSLAQKAGCRLREEPAGQGRTVILDEGDKFRVPDRIVEADEAHAFVGLAMGLRKPLACTLGAPFASPLRHVLPRFGFECQIESLNQKKNEDPLVRRMRFLTTGRKSEGPQQFSLKIDFSKDPVSEAEVTLPGDDLLASLIVAAKCLVPKGSLIVENVSLETWSTPLLQLLKNMGAVLSTQETHECSFGSVGSVVLQKINPFGRKVDCRPRYQFALQLPIMVVMAMFAQGQSIFRNLEDLRRDEPDGIDLLNSCIATVGARFGEMPDGIVVEGAKQFDAFDLKTPLPAAVAGAFAVAALKCRGTTTIADEPLARWWPDFKGLLASIMELKEQ